MTTATLERPDHDLVAAVREGDDRAFEALYERYQRRIQAFVYGMVKDQCRAEDVTQEVFVAALRRMRATERPIAFKPWVYEIAKNACIDAFRRSRRAEEVSYDAAEGLTPSDHRRLTGGDATPDTAVAAKQELETLCGAFGGLSDAHHEILVMRELEGLSYREIGERMGMSRPAVESTLFRARRRLTEEYGELVSGERCRRVQGIIATAAGGQLGARDARRLARHVAHCQACRREALAAGLDRSLIARPPVRRRVAARVAAWLPLPAFVRSRVAAHLPEVADQLSGGWGKLAAGAAVLAAGLGAGVGVQHHIAHAQRPAAPAAHSSGVSRPASKPAAAARPAAVRGGSGTARRASGSSTGAVRRGARGGVSGRAAAPAAPKNAGSGASRPSASPKRSSRSPGGSTLPSAASGPASTVRQTVNNAGNAAQGAAGAAGQAVQGATGAAGGVVKGATGTAGGVVKGATGTAGGVVKGATGTAGGVVKGATGTAGGVVKGATGTAGGVVKGAAGTAQGATRTAGGAAKGATGTIGGAVNGTTGALGGL